MSKSLAAIVAFLFCAISINAQQSRPLPTKLDDFARYTFLKEGTTTELIECSATSNIYKKIDIDREFGIPRFGIITDCNQNIDTVQYIPNNLIRSESGGITSPLFTDTAITIWWKSGNFTVNIMNVLTGDVVLSETHSEQAANEFNERIDSLKLADSTIIEFPGGFTSPKTSNPGITITYSDLANGLYWVYIVDDNNVIWYMNTLRKGI